MSPTPLSPCVRRCALVDGVCTGCRRTIHEVVAWSSLDAAARLSIMKDLEERA